MNRGFTLIELLIVVSLMAMLGVAATGGYAALQRGMEERGAVSAINAFLRGAQERARIEQVPTKVFVYNRLIRQVEGETTDSIVVGEAVAIRRAGRISRVGEFLFDEYSDLGSMFDVITTGWAERPGMRLWRFSPTDSKTLEYSIVADAVGLGTLQEEDLQGGPSVNIQAYGFFDQDKGNHKPSAWAVGHAYAFEFATIQLPKNYIFGDKIPNDVGDVVEVAGFYFDPAKNNTKEVDVWSCRTSENGAPIASRKVGAASADLDGGKTE